MQQGQKYTKTKMIKQMTVEFILSCEWEYKEKTN